MDHSGIIILVEIEMTKASLIVFRAISLTDFWKTHPYYYPLNSLSLVNFPEMGPAHAPEMKKNEF